MQCARQFQAMADPTRLRVLALLAAGPLCVCHFQSVLREPQAKISKHLAILRSRGLVSARREGHWMVYALAQPRPVALGGLDEVLEAEPKLRKDRERLAKLDLTCTPVAAARKTGRKACC